MTDVVRLRAGVNEDEAVLRKRIEECGVHFAVIGAQEEHHDLRTIGVTPEQVSVSWDDRAGEMSMLSAFGAHVVAMNELIFHHWWAEHAYSLRHRFAVVRGRLAEWSPEGLALQPIRAGDPDSLTLVELTAGELETREQLAGDDGRCLCPVCGAHFRGPGSSAFVAMPHWTSVHVRGLLRINVPTDALFSAANTRTRDDHDGWQKALRNLAFFAPDRALRAASRHRADERAFVRRVAAHLTVAAFEANAAVDEAIASAMLADDEIADEVTWQLRELRSL